MRRVLIVVIALAGCRQLLGLDEPQRTPGDGPKPDVIMIDTALTSDAGCPAQCTTCNPTTKTCTVDCSKTSCQNKVACPLGYHCDIQCSATDSCRNGVDCLQGLSCIVECSGQSSCRNVTCGAGACDVMCSGQASCNNVACGNSCACDVTCATGAQCTGVTCTSLACASGSGCTSVPANCHSCM